MNEDREIAAMSSIAVALQDLEPEEQQRILRWACSRYGVEARLASHERPRGGTTGDGNGESQFSDIASLYDAAGPKTDTERALVAGYWYQVCQGQPALDAQLLNTALKNLGHGLSNITAALTTLKERKPALVMQTREQRRTVIRNFQLEPDRERL